MTNARRAYVYLAAAISLQALTWAAIYLLRNLLRGEARSLDAVAFSAAVVLVSLPVYVGHWLWAGRLLREDPNERSALARWLYLYAMLALFLAPLISNAVGLLAAWLARWLHAPLPIPELSGELVGDGLRELGARNGAALLVLGALWLAHWRLTRREAAAAPLSGDPAAVRRLYLLGFSLAGGVLAVVGANRVLRWILYQVPQRDVMAGPSTLALADACARLLVGLALWALAWRAAEALARGDEGERRAVLRLVYLYVVTGLAALTVIANCALVLTGLFRTLLALPPRGDLRGPLPVIAIVGLVWAYHAWLLRQEAAAETGSLRTSVRRGYTYLVAAAGLAAAVVGLTSLLAVLLRALLDGGFDLAAKEQLAWSAAVLLAGLPVWAWAWRRAQRWVAPGAVDAAGEREATTRRLYVALWLLVGVVMVLVGGVYLLYRPLAMLIGAPEPINLTVKVGRAAAMLLVGGGLWLYHFQEARAATRVGGAHRAAALSALRALLVETGDGSWAAGVLAELARTLPGAKVAVLATNPAAAARLGGTVEPGAAADQVRAAGLIVASAELMAPPEVGVDDAAAALARAVAQSPAPKLLVPWPRPGQVEWAGVAPLGVAAAARQTAAALRQLADGEPVRPESPISLATVLGWAAAALVVLVLASILISAVVEP